MSRRRRRRKSRQKGKTPGGLDSIQGISPKQMQKALGQIDTNEISDVEEVIVRTSDEDIILQNPEVTVMNMGQEIWNIVPQGVKRQPHGTESRSESTSTKPEKEVVVKEEDVTLIMNTVQVSREEAVKAIKESGGDIAAAIMSLK